MTAAATTGPARQPRPTSSTPAMCTTPCRRRSFSTVREARARLMRAPDGLGALHARGLALQVAQEVQLRAPHLRAAEDFDPVDRRRVQRENALDALAERDLPHGERRVGGAAVHADHRAL